MFFLLSIDFKGFNIQGGSQRTILLISFGIKICHDIQKKMINALTCQLGSELVVKC